MRSSYQTHLSANQMMDLPWNCQSIMSQVGRRQLAQIRMTTDIASQMILPPLIGRGKTPYGLLSQASITRTTYVQSHQVDIPAGCSLPLLPLQGQLAIIRHRTRTDRCHWSAASPGLGYLADVEGCPRWLGLVDGREPADTPDDIAKGRDFSRLVALGDEPCNKLFLTSNLLEPSLFIRGGPHQGCLRCINHRNRNARRIDGALRLRPVKCSAGIGISQRRPCIGLERGHVRRALRAKIMPLRAGRPEQRLHEANRQIAVSPRSGDRYPSSETESRRLADHQWPEILERRVASGEGGRHPEC